MGEEKFTYSFTDQMSKIINSLHLKFKINQSLYKQAQTYFRKNTYKFVLKKSFPCIS